MLGFPLKLAAKYTARIFEDVLERFGVEEIGARIPLVPGVFRESNPTLAPISQLEFPPLSVHRARLTTFIISQNYGNPHST